MNALALKAIEMTLSKEAADWWKQYSFKHWPINKATVCKWHQGLKKNGKIYTLGTHKIGRKLEGPKLHERGIFKSLQLEFEAQVRQIFKIFVVIRAVTLNIYLKIFLRAIMEHYKYVEIKKFNQAFVKEKLLEHFDVHLGRSQVSLYMNRTSWLKYNAEKKCYEVSVYFARN